MRLRQIQHLLRDEGQDHLLGHRRNPRQHGLAKQPLEVKLACLSIPPWVKTARVVAAKAPARTEARRIAVRELRAYLANRDIDLRLQVVERDFH
jgi:hypothetical protein